MCHNTEPWNNYNQTTQHLKSCYPTANNLSLVTVRIYKCRGRNIPYVGHNLAINKIHSHEKNCTNTQKHLIWNFNTKATDVKICLFLNVNFKKPLSEGLCRQVPDLSGQGFGQRLIVGVCGFSVKSQHIAFALKSHTRQYIASARKAYSCWPLCMCDYALSLPTFYTHHTPAPPHTRTRKGRVGGWR